MHPYFTPEEIARSRFSQLLFDFLYSATPIVLTLIFLLAVGAVLVSVIVAGFARNQRRYEVMQSLLNADPNPPSIYKNRPTQTKPDALTTEELRQARRFANLEEGCESSLIGRPRHGTKDGDGGDAS